MFQNNKNDNGNQGLGTIKFGLIAIQLLFYFSGSIKRRKIKRVINDLQNIYSCINLAGEMRDSENSFE